MACTGWGGRVRTSAHIVSNPLKRRATHVPLLSKCYTLVIQRTTNKLYCVQVAFADLFARLSAKANQRWIVYKVLRPSWFVVSGKVNDENFYSRYHGVPDGSVGFTLSLWNDSGRRKRSAA